MNVEPSLRDPEHTFRPFWHILRVLAGAVGVVGGGLIWHYADELMLRRIYLIGEENALGRDNVIRLPDGSTLFTNPGAMIYYELPFLAGAAVLVMLGLWLWFREFRAILTETRRMRIKGSNEIKGSGVFYC